MQLITIVRMNCNSAEMQGKQMRMQLSKNDCRMLGGTRGIYTLERPTEITRNSNAMAFVEDGESFVK